jgi:hypothetical protein
VTAAPCWSCRRPARVLVTMRSPRGPYQLCVRCLGSDAAPLAPAPTSEVEIAGRNARAAAVADALGWLADPAAWRRSHPERAQGSV